MLWLTIPVALVVGVIATVVVVAVYSRRDDAKPDLPGTRTTVAFKTDGRYTSDEERRAAEDAGAGALGGVLLCALVEELKRAQLTADEPDADDYGWGVTVTRDGKSAYVLVGFVGDEDE